MESNRSYCCNSLIAFIFWLGQNGSLMPPNLWKIVVPNLHSLPRAQSAEVSKGLIVYQFKSFSTDSWYPYCSLYWLTTVYTWQVGVMRPNPEKSKHLEVTKMSIEGFCVDLVHLRSETYADQGSHKSQTDFGTPLQDAVGRDITINSLFYNINTEKASNPRDRSAIAMLCSTPVVVLPFVFYLDCHHLSMSCTRHLWPAYSRCIWCSLLYIEHSLKFYPEQNISIFLKFICNVEHSSLL